MKYHEVSDNLNGRPIVRSQQLQELRNKARDAHMSANDAGTVLRTNADAVTPPQENGDGGNGTGSGAPSVGGSSESTPEAGARPRNGSGRGRQRR